MANRKQTPDVLGAVLGDPVQTVSAPNTIKTSQPKKPTPKRKSPQRKPEATILPPRQWEYMIIRFQDYRGWKARFVDDQEVTGWKQLPDMPNYINQLGLEGWEMAGANNAGRNQLQVFFKRPKESG